jgi:hypothetical protein
MSDHAVGAAIAPALRDGHDVSRRSDCAGGALVPVRKSRLSAAVIVFLIAFGVGATAADPVEGYWSGHYACAQGVTGLTLSVTAGSGSRVHALFHFYADASNPTVPEGCFEMDGTFDPATHHMELRAGSWLLRPYGYVTVDLSGQLSSGDAIMGGKVIGPFCTWFQLRPAAAGGPHDASACQERGETVASVIPP